MDAQSHLLSRTIKFGSFDPIPFTPSVSKRVAFQENGGNIQDDNGWILVTRRRDRHKYPQKSVKVQTRAKMIKGLTKTSTPKLIQERANPPRYGNSTMHSPITLNEFMSI